MNNQVEVTEIYVIADEFCKSFFELLNRQLIDLGGDKKIRNKPCKLSDSEVITILVLFHLRGFRCLKHFYLNYVQQHMKGDFPKTVSYNRFVELSQKSIIPMVLLMKTMMREKCTGISFIDSTALKVCNNRRIHNHKVFKGIAERGHCSVGYFFGFKLHIIINEKGELLSYALTKGNKHDGNHQGIHVVTKIRSNMKNCLMSLKDKIMLRKRAVVECVNDELKNICQIEHSRHRSFNNFIANLVSGLIAYCFLPKKPSINVIFENQKQLVLLP
jgi:hypothetical protein